MSASPFCPHCGAMNPSEETTCFACGHALADAAVATMSAPALRELRQRYRLVRQIGAGGFGAVYKAEDTQLGNRLVAVKEMSAHGLTPQEAQEATESFHREALLLARLGHPNLPRIYEQFEEGGHWYLVMDFIEGQTLEDYLEERGGSLPVKEALQIGVQLAGVLGYLHTRQPPIVFRDLKPANVMRTPDGQLFLIDFGIARLFKPGQQKDTIAFGSPGYAAPEQYGKAQTTPRSDVFSLGALLHHLLTGIDPSDTPFRFQPLTMPRPAGLSTLILSMVDIDVDKRPASMELVQRELKRLLDDPAPWRSDTSTMPAAGAYSSPPPAATGAFPAVAPPPAVWQPPATHGPTVVTPLPVQRKKKNGWGCLIALFIVGAIILGNLSHNNNNNINTDPDGSAAPSPVPVYALAWSPDGNEIAFGGKDGQLELWSLDEDKPSDISIGFDKINALAWSPDGSRLAVAEDFGGVQIVDAEGVSINGYAISSSSFAVNALAWSPKGDLLALATTDGIGHVVDAATGISKETYQADASALTVVAWSPDGKQIAFGSTDETVRIWDTSTHKQLMVLHDKQAIIEMIAWSPDGQTLASGDGIGQLMFWNPKVDNPLATFPATGRPLKALAWSPDGHYLAASGDSYSVQVWEAADHSLAFTYSKHTDTVTAVAWSANSQRIASASYDGTVRVWDALSGDNEQVEYLP